MENKTKCGDKAFTLEKVTVINVTVSFGFDMQQYFKSTSKTTIKEKMAGYELTHVIRTIHDVFVSRNMVSLP